MTKEGKGAATIRRRKLRHTNDEKEKVRSSTLSSPADSDNEQAVDEEEEGYIFEEEVLGPLIVKKLMATEKTILLGLIALRISNSLLIQTSFVPDEYWQSLEVAHNVVFDYGYLTWEWKEGIRSYLYPTVFVFLYKFLAIFGLDHRLMLIKLPRILQGVIAAFGDLYLFKLSWRLTDRATAQWTLLCQILSWFTLYCCTRTLTNCTETVLVTMALYYYPWPLIVKGTTSSASVSSASLVKFIALASLSVLVRPTAAVIWILMCSWHIQHIQHSLGKVVKHYIVVGSVCFLLSTFLDSIYHGDWIIVHFNFLEFNVIKGGAAIYGTHPWHWYITQGYPVVMGTLLVPFVLGAYRAKNKALLFLITWTIFINSFISHKEFRFLMPILPISMHYCGVYFQTLCKKPRIKRKKNKKVTDTTAEGENTNIYSSSESLVSSVDSTESSLSTSTSGETTEKTVPVIDCNITAPSKDNKECSKSEKEEEVDPAIGQQKQHKYNLSKAKLLVIFLVITNVPMAVYFGLIHQRGTVVVMKYLYDASENKNVDVLFLMPCHSTPYYSYLHRNISMRFLTCEPNLSEAKNYIDEADQFYNNPVKWLKREYHAQKKTLPSHVIYFNTLQSDINSFLTQSGYKDCGLFFHTHLPEGRVGSHVKVSCR